MAELPFVEKYRPVGLQDLVGDSNIEALKAFVKTGQFPLAMVFWGPYGVGKTTAAKALVRDYLIAQGLYLPDATFQDIRSGSKISPEYTGIFPPVLYVDAAVTRDIEFIKDVIQNFMRTMPPRGVKKFVVFDESDRLSFDAQRALRALLEKYPGTVTIYTTNELGKIDPAIVDRASGAVFEFQYPSVEDVTLFLKGLAAREYVEIPDEKLRHIAADSKSIREAVGRLGTEVAVARVKAMKEVALEKPAPVSIEAEIAEVSKLLKSYNIMGNRPPLELQNRAKVIMEKLMAERGIDKCERYERPKYRQFWGNKESTLGRLLDTWINGWDIKDSISELSCIKEVPKPVITEYPGRPVLGSEERAWLFNVQIPYLEERLQKAGRMTAEGVAVLNQIAKLQEGKWDEVTEGAYQSYLRQHIGVPTPTVPLEKLEDIAEAALKELEELK